MVPESYPFKRRFLEEKLRESLKYFPSVTVIGPRQSGKTTLVRKTLPDYTYVNLEDPENRTFAREDPRGFLALYPEKVIFDEVQRVPELLSYLQPLLDEDPSPGRFVFTGSGRFQLLKNITQSLAGRTVFLTLLPFSLRELRELPPLDPENLGKEALKLSAPPFSLEEILFKGFYPPVHVREVPARQWLASYYVAYVERDVRELLNLGNLEAFQKFVRLCAGRAGQILNLSSLASEAGISHTTARRWLSVLQAAFVVYLLPPHHENFSKRLIKSPKLYFYDTGLLCYLLGIRTPEDLHLHPLRGAIFENFVFAELYKAFAHRGEEPPLYFWRDRTGHEVDFLLDLGTRLLPAEVKYSQTITREHLRNLLYYCKLAGRKVPRSLFIYAGERSLEREGVTVCPWFYL
ncbi:ATP-binding protein [Thermosulfurimonas marina]|uniref:ATP-binding protein n=1 Tax=Thermosulfurimonas marina TaxID=2047767 RepID=A0A6H1WQF3_9BACT|nr:ATP-binding protein [Thermosulfurimonas marina]QJA05366.1 ATP-binding protein [Thermosulfurimonas marina]